MSRSVLRPDQLDSNGSYSFAQLVIDGYSEGDLQDGYLTGLVLEDRANGGAVTLELHADDGEINQIGSGQVTFNGDVRANQDVIIEGDLTVRGTTTSIETDQMVVTDPITVINASGTELLSNWTGFSARDGDGYNRMGWVFDDSTTVPDDGYWAVSVHDEYSSTSDIDPNRAIAYLAAGDSYGDLSSTLSGDSGADKIGVSTIPGLTSTTVQGALEEISPYDVNGGYHIGEAGECIFFDGDVCSDIIPCCDDAYSIGDSTHRFSDGYFGYVDATTVNATTVDATTVDATTVDATTVNATDVNTENLTTTGDTVLGSGPEDCIIFNGVICSDIIPCCDDAYDIGDETHRFNDGYFTNLSATNFTVDNDLTVTGDLTVDGDTILGSGPEDCVIFNGSVCSDIIPCCDDAYQIGDPTHRFSDGYFVNLDIDSVAVTELTVTNITTEDITVNGDTILGDDAYDCVVFNASICSDMIPCCDDAYQIGDATHRWVDGYFAMPTFTNITPVGSDDSLIGVLEGIDNALSDAIVDHPRGVYLATVSEGVADELDSSRTPDQGDVVDVGAGDITDAVFRDNIFVYRNGQLLWNDPTPATNAASVVNDVARQTGSLSDLVFSGNLKKGAVIQIVDMR